MKGMRNMELNKVDKKVFEGFGCRNRFVRNIADPYVYGTYLSR